MDVHTFLSHYQSFPTVLQQEQFLYKTYPRTYSLDQTRESHLIDHLLSVGDVKEKSHVRLQLLGVKLLVIYRDTDRLFELLVNHKAYSPDVYLLAIMTGCRLLSDEQVKSLLFPTSESGSDLIKQYGSPVFLNALVKAVSRNKRSVIDRDLLMRVASNDSFSNNNVLVLLSGVLPNGEQSDNLIVDILVNVLHEHDLKIYKNLVKNHPEALLKFLRVLQQREHSLLTDSARQSYETYVESMVRIVGPNWGIITAIASTNKDLNLKVIQLLREWFVDPLEQIHSHTGMCSILRLRFSTFARNKDAFLDLLVDGRANKGLIAKRYELQNEFSHLVKEYSVQQLTRLFELFVGADFNLPVKQSELALWLLTSMPTSKSRDLYKVEEFQRHLWQKYGEKLENWLVKHVEIDQLCYLIPELGSIIADKRFQVDQVTVPGLTLFHNKCTYLKYMKASVSDDERLTEFMNNCSDPNPEVRAIVLSSLLLASFYHSTNQKKIVQFVVQQMKNEHNEFMEIFERRIRPDYYMHKEGNTLYSLIRAHMVQDDELLALWKSLISLIARRTQNFQEIVWVIASAYRGSEEKDKLTRWAFDVAKSCSPTQIADFLVGQHFRFDSRDAPILWNLECLSNLMLDYFKEQVSRGKFDEMGSFFKQTNPLLHSKQLSGLYKNVFIPALLALPIITDENNIRELQYLVDKIHLFCSQNEVDEIFYRLIERDPSFIFCLSVQRWVLSKRTSITLLEKYLSLNENSTMSYAELHDLKKDANHILANQSGCIYCLNPHLMREQRIERYLSEDTMNKITRMLIFSDRILMKSNATLSSNSFVPSHLTLHAHSHMPPRLAQKRIVQFAGRMQVEKQEALFFRNLVNEIILTLPDDGVIVKDDVLGIVRMSKYLTAHCPEELLQDILNDMTSEYSLYYYDALMRCSSFIPVQQWIQQLSDFITQKQADYEKGISSPNWGITPQKILFSWFKKLWFFKTGFNASQLIEMFIHLFHNDKTHRDTKRVIIEVLLSYVASIVDSESKEAQKVLSIVIGSLDHEYAEIPRAVMRQVYRLSFKCREIHDSLLFSVSQLLSHEDLNICLEAWTTTSESLAPRNNGTSMLSKKAMELIVNQCVKQYLLFDHELRQELISLVTSTMVNVASGDQSAVKEKFVNGLTALISNPQYIELDLEFDNEHGFDRPRFERLKKICDQLSTEIRQRDNVSALRSVFVQPLIDLMLKYEPLLYSDRGVGLTLIVARTADELFDTLSQIVHNLCSLTNESLQRVCAQNALNSVIHLISSIGRGVRSTERQVVSPSDYEQLVRNVEKKYEQLSSSDSNSLEYELWTGILYIVLHSGLEKMLSAWEDCSLISMIRRQNQTHPLVGYVCATMSGIHREGPNRDRRGRGRLRGRGLRRGLPRY